MADQNDGVMTSLLYADRMTVELYEQAADKVRDELAGSLRRFRNDYETNAERLGELIGESEPRPTDEMQALEEDLSRVLNQARDEVDVLEALLLAERTNAVLFRAADETEPPLEHSRLLAKHHEDTQRHASYMEARIPEAERSAAGGLASAGEQAGSGGEVERMQAMDERRADGEPTAPDDQGMSCITGMTDDRNPDDFE